MEPVLELPIRLPGKGSRRLLRNLHQQLRAAILDGRLQPGLRMPSTRAFAMHLGVSRNTAIASYDLLLSEGYLTSRPGAGTFVADMRPRQNPRKSRATEAGGDGRLAAFWRGSARSLRPRPAATPRFDFRVGLPDRSLLPLQVWRRVTARALRTLSKSPTAYAEPEGRHVLRDAISKHVSFARLVACQADDVVVTAGAQQAFDLIARILVTPGKTTVAVEEPGYPPLRAAFAAAGAKLVTVAVDSEGLVVDQLPSTTRVICVTPSHQFPLGIVMSPRRRMTLLDFAQSHDAAVIEDDYDSEFRYDGRSLDALKTLDQTDLVFYVGTFSKSLFPEIRLGFVVVPKWAQPALVEAKRIADWHGTVLAQEALAIFIDEGHMARHVRKARTVYGRRRGELLRALAAHCGKQLQPMGGASGLHLAARLLTPVGARVVAASAAEIGIEVTPLDAFAKSSPALNGLVFGYGMIGEKKIDEGLRGLAGIIRRHSRR